jgi:hypothetical protein
MECWSVGKIVVERFLFALLHYSKGIGFNKRTGAEGDASTV